MRKNLVMHFVIKMETLAAGPTNILVTNYIVIALLTLFTPDFDRFLAIPCG